MGEMAQVTVGWNDEYEQPWIDEGDWADDGRSFAVNVDRRLVDRWRSARNRLAEVEAQVVEAARFDVEHARLTVCCPSWDGNELPGVDVWEVRCGEEPVAWFHSQAGADRLVADLQRLRDRHALLMVGSKGMGGQPLAVDPARLEVVYRPHPAVVSPCHRCGWERDDHPKKGDTDGAG